jgi:hypothetical protein
VPAIPTRVAVVKGHTPKDVTFEDDDNEIDEKVSNLKIYSNCKMLFPLKQSEYFYQWLLMWLIRLFLSFNIPTHS